MIQKSIFCAGEADAWLERNRSGLAHFDAAADPLVRQLRPHLKDGATIAEVGCSLAARVGALAEMADGHGRGVDPSAQAISEAKRNFPRLEFTVATADSLPWATDSVDVLIYGFCLYLCDRSDLFRIAAEGDRVLRNNGLLAILDFQPPFPYRNSYVHRPGVFSYKMDHSRLWTWNPAYVEIAREVFDHGCRNTAGDSTYAPDERVGVSVLKKLSEFSHGSAPRYGSE